MIVWETIHSLTAIAGRAVEHAHRSLAAAGDSFAIASPVVPVEFHREHRVVLPFSAMALGYQVFSEPESAVAPALAVGEILLMFKQGGYELWRSGLNPAAVFSDRDILRAVKAPFLHASFTQVLTNLMLAYPVVAHLERRWGPAGTAAAVASTAILSSVIYGALSLYSYFAKGGLPRKCASHEASLSHSTSLTSMQSA